MNTTFLICIAIIIYFVYRGFASQMIPRCKSIEEHLTVPQKSKVNLVKCKQSTDTHGIRIPGVCDVSTKIIIGTFFNTNADVNTTFVDYDCIGLGCSTISYYGKKKKVTNPPTYPPTYVKDSNIKFTTKGTLPVLFSLAKDTPYLVNFDQKTYLNKPEGYIYFLENVTN